ncbi:MAG: hypothetical protein ABJ034_02600, partial [Hyphomicrobiales bacterium]
QVARNRLEEIAILGVVASYAWISANASTIENEYAKTILWLLPCLISVTAYTRQKTITRGIDRIARFTQEQERLCSIPADISWEFFVEKNRSEGRFSGNRKSADFLWQTVVAATFLIGGIAVADINLRTVTESMLIPTKMYTHSH